ncbi:nicotinate-nucleotide--dimethylbenzimidazole phosphoribosyltransferase [Streptomyces sp. NPDC048172]|uniref:nicotinate-nucleotide--dimethylbenzimidazole phosphoribosyltransferase n=1 Tax=Streptomyces sp. NPDC048172 TaxID=3365505 RepID=UPI003719F635
MTAPGQHETDGRDSGSIDLGAVREQQSPAPAAPAPGAPSGVNGRRPLHLGPPVPEQSGAVRPLSDRGAAPVQAPGQQGPAPTPPQGTPVPQGTPAQGTPVQPSVPAQATQEPQFPQAPQASQAPQPVAQEPNEQQAPAQAEAQAEAQAQPEAPAEVPVQHGTPPHATPVREQGPPTIGPEYLDVAHQEGEALPGPQLGEFPAQLDAWAAGNTQPAPAEAAPAETVGREAEATVSGQVPDASEQQQAAAQEATPAEGTPVAAAEQTAEAPGTAEAPEAPTAPEATESAEPAEAPEAAEETPAAEEPSQNGPIAVSSSGEAVPQGVPAQETPAEDTPAEGTPAEGAPAEGVPAEGGEAEQSAAPSINQDGPAAEAAPSSDGEDGAPAAAETGTEAARPEAETPAAEPQADAAPGTADGEADTDAAQAADEAPQDGPVGEPAPGFAEAEREAVHRLMRERRDIRNGFRTDPIPHEVLLRVLEAAHTAPSVGHSQPWDFVVIRSEETRRTMHEMAQRQREAYAKSLPKARAKQFKELKTEAILDTPVNIVVTADPTRGGRHTLGRHTQPQMAPYSSALAVENLWLAARAEGLGVGWVSFFDEREMVRALELPEHLEVVAYLCVGYVDEFPPEPELMQAGWSKRRPLSWVVHEESYGRRVLPGAEPHDLLSETLDAIRPLDAKALGEAWERQKRMTKPAGALGMLEIISAQLCGLSRKCPPPIPEPAAVAVFAGDHGVHAQGVTPWPQEVTSQMVANFLGGGAVCNAFANQVGAEVCVVDVGVATELPATPGLLPRKVRYGTSDMTTGPALTRDEVARAIEVGVETARDLVAAGNKALLTGEMGIANTTASAALISVCTGADPAEVTGRGTGINDETHARKVEVVRRALDLHKPDPADPIGLLSAVGGLEHAAMVGLILGGASLRTPVILDGVSAGAAALVARALAPEALAACIAGHRSAEPGHVAALTKLGLRPLVDLDLRLGEGTGALLALPMVQSAARTMHEVATFDAAGVTEKS